MRKRVDSTATTSSAEFRRFLANSVREVDSGNNHARLQVDDYSTRTAASGSDKVRMHARGGNWKEKVGLSGGGERRKESWRASRTKQRLSRELFTSVVGGSDGAEGISSIGKGILDAANSSHSSFKPLPLLFDLSSLDPHTPQDPPTTFSTPPAKRLPLKPSLSSFRFGPTSLPVLPPPSSSPDGTFSNDLQSLRDALEPPRSPRTTSLPFRPFTRRASDQSSLPQPTPTSVDMTRDSRSFSLSSATLKSRFWSRNKSTPPPSSSTPASPTFQSSFVYTLSVSISAEPSSPTRSTAENSPTTTKTIPRRPSLSELALKVLHSFNRGKEQEDESKNGTKGTSDEGVEILSTSGHGDGIVRDEVEQVEDALEGFMSPELRKKSISSIAPQVAQATSELSLPAPLPSPARLSFSTVSSVYSDPSPLDPAPPLPLPLSPRKPSSSTTPRSLQPPPRPRKNSQRPKLSTPPVQNSNRRIISDAVWEKVSISASDVSSSSTRAASGSSGGSSRRRRIRKESGNEKGKEREVEHVSNEISRDERPVSSIVLPDSPDMTEGDVLAGAKQYSGMIFAPVDTPPPSPPQPSHVQQ